MIIGIGRYSIYITAKRAVAAVSVRESSKVLSLSPFFFYLGFVTSILYPTFDFEPSSSSSSFPASSIYIYIRREREFQ